MGIGTIAALGYGIASVLFLAMAWLLLTRWSDRPKSPILALASLTTLVWAVIEVFATSSRFELPAVVTVAELLRGIVWATVLLLILGTLDKSGRLRAHGRWFGLVFGIAVITAGILFRMHGPVTFAETAQVAGGLVLSMALVILSEQVFRNADTETGSGFRYFCLAIAAMFTYDIVFYLLAVVEGYQSVTFWAARGYVNALLVVPLLYAVRKRFNLSVDTLLSRQIVFYSYSLVAIGVLFLGIFAGDYYMRTFGGSWSEVLRILFVAAVLLAGGVLVISPSMRATARVLMTKALFQYKYDYRREWLRFIATLSQSGPEQQVPTTAVRAIAQIVNSPGGAVWARPQDEEAYVPAGSWHCELAVSRPVGRDAGLVRFLRDRQWVIDLDEMRRDPARYEGHSDDELPDRDNDWWLIVPMLLGDRLSGFIMLLRPNIVPVLNFEDHDLLKTAGRHVATHIEQAESDRRLAEASQFGAYNRLTAFLMHDLNNLIAQQSLVVENAERFRHNPDFVDDAIDTIAHSVARMRRLMEQLSSASKPPLKKRVRLCSAIRNAVERTATRRPAARLLECDEEVDVQADAERLSMVIEHLLRNAQEATPPDGEVTVAAHADGDRVTIVIADTGSGMTQEFIRTRLFRPFDSTKGSQGMGIGVYQAREYARALGGQLDVNSEPGAGTEFRITLPVG